MVEVAVTLVVTIAGTVTTESGGFDDIIHQETEKLPLDLASGSIVAVAPVAVGADARPLLLGPLNHLNCLEEVFDAGGGSGRHPGVVSVL